eukprot:SAG11_NODE_1203_length_5535_cov_13.559235_6_plen_126_part_00
MHAAELHSINTICVCTAQDEVEILEHLARKSTSSTVAERAVVQVRIMTPIDLWHVEMADVVSVHAAAAAGPVLSLWAQRQVQAYICHRTRVLEHSCFAGNAADTALSQASTCAWSLRSWGRICCR